MKHMFSFAVVATIIVMTVAGCGATPAPTATPIPAKPAAPPANPQANLIEAAKQEGEVMLYTSLNTKELAPLMKKFGEKYPFLKAKYYQDTSVEMVQKAQAEARSGQYLADVYEVDDLELLPLYTAKLLAAYKSPEAAAYAEGARHPWDYYTADRLNSLVIAYNTKQVKAEDAPQKLTDLLDSKWSGKIAVERDDWVLLFYTATVMGDGPANDFWTRLSRMRVRVIQGHTELAQAIATGEVTISPTVYSHRVEALKKEGAAIEWVKTNPVYALLQVVGVAAKAPHPNAARLLVDWLLSAEGQTELVKVGRVPARPGITANPPGLTAGIKFYYGDATQIADPNKLRTQYYNLFGIK